MATLRSVGIIVALASFALIAAGVMLASYLFRAPALPAEPGNYVVISGGRCELRLVRANPAENAMVAASACEPTLKGSSMLAGFTVTTAICGDLHFGPAEIPGTNYACSECEGLMEHGCPLVTRDASAKLGWRLIE